MSEDKRYECPYCKGTVSEAELCGRTHLDCPKCHKMVVVSVDDRKLLADGEAQAS